MIELVMRKPGEGMSFFRFEVHCRSGVIGMGCHADFLAAVLAAREAKRRFVREMPSSRFRARVLYPNGQPVTKADIRAALNALSDSAVLEAVQQRQSAFSARARTEEHASGKSGFFSVSAPRDFCQASVVAPPDSPNFGKSADSVLTGLEGGR